MSVRLKFLPRGDAPTRWWTIDDGRVVARGAQSEADADQRTVMVVPGEAVLCRWLELPAGRDAQAAAAAGFMLEGELAQPRETLHIALGPAEADGRRLAVVVDRARMHAWVDEAAALGLDLGAITPDCLLLPEPDGEEVLAVALGEATLVRGQRLALTCEPAFLPLMLGERPWRLVEDPDAAEALVADGAWRPLLDLRQGSFAVRRAGPPRRLGLIVALAGLLLASLVALPAVKAVRFEAAARAAEAETERLAGPAAQGEAADPVERLRIRLEQARAADGFAAKAAAVFAAVERIEGMELQSLLYGEDGAFHLNAAHANYSDVELLRSALTSTGLTVQEDSAAPLDGRIVSDLTLRPSP